MQKLVAVAVTDAAKSAVLAAPAVAAPSGNMCSPGRTKTTWAGKAKPWVVTCRKVLENHTGGTAKRVFSAVRERGTYC